MGGGGKGNDDSEVAHPCGWVNEAATTGDVKSRKHNFGHEECQVQAFGSGSLTVP